MRYVIYCRKSTESEDRQVLSIEAQERELFEIAQKNGLEVVNVFKESKSAKDVGRPVFAELLTYIRKGNADAILTWKIDRLARNLIDGGAIIDMLQRSVIQEIRTYDKICVPSDNVLMLAVEFGMANQYVRDLSANVKRGNRQKLERGGWTGRAPFGYLNDRANNTIIIDPVRAPYIKRAYEYYASGEYSTRTLAEKLYQEGLRSVGGKKIFKSSVQRIITNPFYMGVMRRYEKLYPGNHEPIVSKQLFDSVAEVLNESVRPKTKTHLFPLRGAMTCHVCGCMITASLKKGHHYYYCTNGRGRCEQHKSYTREKVLYTKVASILHDISFDTELIEIVYEAALERLGRTEAVQNDIYATLRTQLTSLTQKEDRLLNTYLEGQIPIDIYKKKLQEIQNERTLIEKEIETGAKPHDPYATLELTKKVFLTSNIAMKSFLEGDDVQKSEIVKTLLGNLSLKDKDIAEYQLKMPYALLKKVPHCDTFSTLSAH
ncbi:hypothetical protein A3C89_03015 [Candidatus Kaiserbacteria bacterium RIFCSPHIGHO2_02_FULL_50_50]|uniref:Recombinase domain-containing protein n=1 Tax=Candidatus Kaiserbacteria bacterium RIFCSPHIGHO2_02_FULL_50_50 TaxID=1798492 RepID=A0A1F6DD18_9BACT|nr:MAG: hypothetical protein A3C89_03015 [Candidatus Kaiserbacteria bacterium RIFCSPHIGHO2_02_FULL_50_50]OGG88431.1 MAG: hypothetical protein A3G62_01660 [Candidatus Kaiserbacteria bacterium RIFCSPLOWO2_12_FULL_50_10]